MPRQPLARRFAVRAGFWVALTTGTLLAILLTIQLLPDRVSLRLGQAAPEDIIAYRTVRYLDERETERLRAEAAAAVPKRYAVDPNAAAEAEQEAMRFFDVAREVKALHARNPGRPAPEAPEMEIPPALREGPLATALTLDDATLARLAEETARVVRRLMREPIRNDTDDLSRLRRRIPGEVAALVLPAREHALVGTVVSEALRPNRHYELRATLEERRRAREAVEPYYRQVNRGEVILPRGQRARQVHLDQLQALGLQRPHVDLTQAFCLVLMAYGLVALTGFYLYHFHRRVYRQSAALLLLAIVTTATVLLFRLGASALGLKLSGTQLGYVGVIFSATAAMLVAVLVQPQVGVFVGAMMAVLAGLVVNNDLRISILALVSSVVGAAVVSNIRDRAGLLRAGLYVSVANVVTGALVTGVTSPDAGAELMTGAAWGVIGGLMSAFVFALGATLLERPFGVTTHLTLLELSDPNKPLLKRLAIEAPGTYAHSIMVGNLAEAAAEAIGADALFARVASYYHDVGKIFRPQFFVENQQSGNRHASITPTLSRLVVTSHVKDGVELAEQYRLPPPIIDIIREHHGTCLMRYFYHQAMTSVGECLPTDLEYQFRYEGPRPRTKESGIIMIADAAEAASRTLEKPTPGRVRELVEKIVQERLADGQLDDCELTFKDLERIIASFTRTLAGSLHARIDYPDVVLRAAPGSRLAAAGGERLPVGPGDRLPPNLEPGTWSLEPGDGTVGEEPARPATEAAASAEADRPAGRDAVGS